MNEMMKFAGRSADGLARAVKTNTSGNIEVVNVGSIVALLRETQTLGVMEGNKFATELNLKGSRDVVFGVRGASLAEGDEVELEIVWNYDAVGFNLMASSRETLKMVSAFGEVGAGIRVPALGIYLDFVRIINKGAVSSEIKLSVLGVY